MLQVTVQKILSRKQCANHPKLRENLYDPDLHICAYLSLTRKGRSDACEVSDAYLLAERLLILYRGMRPQRSDKRF